MTDTVKHGGQLATLSELLSQIGLLMRSAETIAQLLLEQTDEAHLSAPVLREVLTEEKTPPAKRPLKCKVCGTTENAHGKPLLTKIQLERHVYVSHTRKGKSQMKRARGISLAAA